MCLRAERVSVAVDNIASTVCANIETAINFDAAAAAAAVVVAASERAEVVVVGALGEPKWFEWRCSV